MKRLALLAPLFLAACQTSPGQMAPYTATGADALSRDATVCESRGLARNSDGYLDCMREMAANEGYWMLVTAGLPQFVAQPAGYQPPPTLFLTGARMNADKDPKPAMVPPVIDMTGTWGMYTWSGSGPETCTFRQTGNQLAGFCKNFVTEGPVVGSIDGQRVGWRWLYNTSFTWDHFIVELFAGTVNSNGKLEGGFAPYGSYYPFQPTFDIKWSTPPSQRFTRRFDAERVSLNPT